jgi:hypothetical protein
MSFKSMLEQEICPRRKLAEGTPIAHGLMGGAGKLSDRRRAPEGVNHSGGGADQSVLHGTTHTKKNLNMQAYRTNRLTSNLLKGKFQSPQSGTGDK